jgi:hypothetical protein
VSPAALKSDLVMQLDCVVFEVYLQLLSFQKGFNGSCSVLGPLFTCLSSAVCISIFNLALSLKYAGSHHAVLCCVVAVCPGPQGSTPQQQHNVLAP